MLIRFVERGKYVKQHFKTLPACGKEVFQNGKQPFLLSICFQCWLNTLWCHFDQKESGSDAWRRRTYAARRALITILSPGQEVETKDFHRGEHVARLCTSIFHHSALPFVLTAFAGKMSWVRQDSGWVWPMGEEVWPLTRGNQPIGGGQDTDHCPLSPPPPTRLPLSMLDNLNLKHDTFLWGI